MANAVTDWKEPTAATQISGGSGTWMNLGNILAGVAGATEDALVGPTEHGWKTLQIIKNGVQTGTDKGTPTTMVDYVGGVETKGGSADLWGNTLTVADVEASNFGVAIEVSRIDTGASLSKRILATGYNFDLPSGATVAGIELRLTFYGYAGGGGTQGLGITKAEMRVHYTFNPRIDAVGDSGNFAYVRNTERVEPDKKYRYLAYDSNRAFIGDITKNVRNEPTFKQAINQLHSNMELHLAQNEQSTATAMDELYTDSNENLTTDTDENILVDLAASVGLGPGTTVEVNNEVDVVAYYGSFEELVTDDGEPIVTDDDELILVQNGRPEGEKIFTGYMSNWDLNFGGGDSLDVNLLSHSKELDNIILETADTVVLEPMTAASAQGWIGIAGSGPTDLIELAQTFTATSTAPIGRLRLKAHAGWLSDVSFSVNITLGSNPTSPGAGVASVSGIIPANPDNYGRPGFVDLVFTPFTPVNGQSYIIFLSTQHYKTGGSETYPANFYTSSGYSGGALWYRGGYDIPNWTSTTSDIYFALYQLGGSSTRTFNSTDPSYILQSILDFAALRGARVAYDTTTIEPTNTLVSITFKTNTIADAIDMVLKTAPADWYYYYDYGDNKVHFHPRPTAPAHYYTRGRDTVRLKISRTIEKLRNDIYFTGGGSPTPLFIRKTDQTRINAWRRALGKESDNRVTVQSTAELLAQSMIDQYGEPLYGGELQVVRVEDFRLEDVVVGELSGFINFGEYIDPLELQNVAITYHPDLLEITLDILTPAVQKRVEDIKRNLALQEHANDPASPTIT